MNITLDQLKEIAKAGYGKNSSMYLAVDVADKISYDDEDGFYYLRNKNRIL